MPNNVSFGVQAKGVGKASSDIDRLRDKFDKLQKQSGKGLLTGLAAGAGLAAVNLASSAVSEFTDVIGDSIAAAKEDEASQQRLRSSLEANIPAWDGNSKAIEDVLAARMKLGFSDDEQRDSLAKIVVATHDVNKALEVQRAAMDLARLKQISLADAGDALIKVEGGQFRALKALGIQLKAGATATDALKAVQAATRGQAEAYAKTNEGKVLVSQVKVNEAMEKAGYVILPAVADATVGVADAVSGLSNVLDLLNGDVADTTDGLAGQLQGSLDLLGALKLFVPAYGAIADAGQGAVDDLQKQAHIWDGATSDMSASTWDATHAIDAAGSDVEGSLDDMGDAAKDWRDTFKDTSGSVIRASNRTRDALVKDAAIIRGEAFDETEIRASLFSAKQDLRAGEDEMRSAKTAADRRAASRDIISALDDEGQSLEDLASKGKLTSKDVEAFAKDVKANYGSLSKDGRHQVDLLLERYRLLASQKNITKTFTLNEVVTHDKGSANDTHGKGRGQLEFAEGGRVPGPIGAPVDATVHGGEFVVSNAMQRSGVAAGIGGDTYIYNIYPQGRWDVDERSVAAALARLKAISKKRPKAAA